MNLTGQFALPKGIGGRLVGRMMAKRHSAQVDAVVAQVAARDSERVLEIGFGPGTGLVALAETGPGVRVAGIDPSATMVAAALRRVRRFGDRVEVREGTAAALPWDDGSFDAVCAVNSVQLWQPRIGSMAEVLRVLKPGGRLVLSVLNVAILPDLSQVPEDFDQVLLKELAEAGFAGAEAEWHPLADDRQAVYVLAGKRDSAGGAAG